MEEREYLIELGEWIDIEYIMADDAQESFVSHFLRCLDGCRAPVVLEVNCSRL